MCDLQIDALSRIERVTGMLNFCDEFQGHPEYDRAHIRQLRLPTLDYCSPTAQVRTPVSHQPAPLPAHTPPAPAMHATAAALSSAISPVSTPQQLENGLDFIRKQPPGACTYIHCKAGRGRAGTMAMAYLIIERGMTPVEAPRSRRDLGRDLARSDASRGSDARAQAQQELRRIRPHVSPRLWKRATVREMHRRHQQRLLQQQYAAQHGQAQQQPPPAAAYAQSPPPVEQPPSANVESAESSTE